MREWRESTWGEEISLEYGKALRDYDAARGNFRVFGSNGPIGWTSKSLVSGPGVILGRKGAYRGVEFSRVPFFVIDTAYYVVPKTQLEMRWLFRPESVGFAAGRAMLNRLNELARRRIDFAFETTLASRSFAPWLRRRQWEGFAVNLIYLWLPSAELAVERVRQRVKAGGHNGPEQDIRRRYDRGRRNFNELYAPSADTWEVYDNSGFEPYLIAFGGRDEPTTVLEMEHWQRIKGEAK